MSENFTCAVCGETANLDQYEGWGDAEMCQSCAQSCKEVAASCVHVWEPHDGGTFCGKCSSVKEEATP